MRELGVEHVVLLSGPIASGKTTLARLLADRFGFCVVSTREFLRKGVGDRLSLQAAGASLDDSTDGRWVRDALVSLHERRNSGVLFVVDSVRTLDQVRWVRETFGNSVAHVHFTAAEGVLSARYGSRSEGYRYCDVSGDRVELGVRALEGSAGLVLDTNCLTPDFLLGKVAGHLDQSQSGIYIDTGLGSTANTVIPANTGIQGTLQNLLSWTPACAGVTKDFVPSGCTN